MQYQEIRHNLYSQLRCYQKDAIDSILTAQNDGIKSILRQNFTGTGKSVEQNFLAINWLAESEDNAYLFLIHREELLENAAGYFQNNAIPFSFIRPKTKTLYSKRAFLAGVDFFKSAARLEEFAKYLNNYNKKLLIVIDEAHHITAKSWSKIVEYFPEAFRVGFTATPSRLDGQGFEKIFEKLLVGKSYQWYVDNKFLAPFLIHLPKQIEMSLTRGDCLNEQEAALTDEILGDAVKVWQKFTLGLKTFTFCPTITVSKKVEKLYNDFGLIEYGREIAAHLDGSTDKTYRRECLRRFNLPTEHDESLLILTNVELFIEGVNVQDCQVTQHLRATKSEIYFDQMNGRSNRFLVGKTQHIIDHVGNVSRHGIPNRDRTFDLRGRKKKALDAKYRLMCPVCDALLTDDYRLLEVNNGWLTCQTCNVETTIPGAKHRTQSRKSGSLAFTDCEFTTLSPEHYKVLNQQAIFAKLAKIQNDLAYLEAVANQPTSDLSTLIAACKFRNISESKALAVWSRRLKILNQ